MFFELKMATVEEGERSEVHTAGSLHWHVKAITTSKQVVLARKWHEVKRK